jgi:uncharacterized protein
MWKLGVRVPHQAQFLIKNNVMTLHEKINEDMISAMKSRDQETLNILRVVKGEFGRVGKDLTDDQAIPIIRKMVENAKDLGNHGEIMILDKYLPQMLGENLITLLVNEIIQINGFSGIQDMGKVMGEIKKLPSAAQIDGKIASQIVKELLSK